MKTAKILAPSLWALSSACLACPFCTAGLTNSPAGRGFGVGVYYSILVLLAVFFGMVGFLVFYLVREARREAAMPPQGSGRQESAPTKA